MAGGAITGPGGSGRTHGRVACGSRATLNPDVSNNKMMNQCFEPRCLMDRANFLRVHFGDSIFFHYQFLGTRRKRGKDNLRLRSTGEKREKEKAREKPNKKSNIQYLSCSSIFPLLLPPK